METKSQRRALLSEFIDVMPTLDVRPFVQVIDNIASSLGDAAKGEIDPVALGEMTNKILQLHRDLHDLLPPERIDLMARDADEWAAKQKKRILDQRRDAQKRLASAESSEDYGLDGSMRRGEVERF